MFASRLVGQQLSAMQRLYLATSVGLAGLELVGKNRLFSGYDLRAESKLVSPQSDICHGNVRVPPPRPMKGL